MMEFLKQIFDAIAGFFKQAFGWLTGNGAQNTPAPTSTTQGAGTEKPQHAETATVEQGIEDTVAKKDARENPEIQNDITAALTKTYQHTGEKAELLNRMGEKSDRLFKGMWAAEKADTAAWSNTVARGQGKEAYISPEDGRKAWPAWQQHAPSHGAVLDARSDLERHWDNVNALFADGGMKDTGLSKLAVNPVNAVSASEVFTQDKHGLRINMPANSRLDIKPVNATQVSVTVRPISDDPKNTYNFAPVTLPAVSREVFEENYALVQPSKRGRTEIYVKAGTFDDPPVIGVLEGGRDVAGKGAYLAMAVKGKDGKTTSEIQAPVAALSTYTPRPRKRTVDFSGASMPVGVDHTDPRDDYGSLFPQAVRAGGYHQRSSGNYSGGGFYGAGGGQFGNITEVTRPSGTPHNNKMFGRPGRSGPSGGHG